MARNIIISPQPTYGCGEKPSTDETLYDTRIGGASDTHDVTYTLKRFEGCGWTGDDSSFDATVCLLIRDSSYNSNIYNITFDRCVFATCDSSVISNAVHMLNLSTTGKTIYNITFSYCWFEPWSRFGLEWNGRAGWWHDLTIDHCTFEHGGGGALSFDMSPIDGDPQSPWGITVGGVVRGVEGLHVTHNLIGGSGAVVNGFTPTTLLTGLELSCIYPYCPDHTVASPNTYTPDNDQLAATRSEFSNNRIGRNKGSWLQFNRNGSYYLTFANNHFDNTYNPGEITEQAEYFANTSAHCNHCDFSDNHYTLGENNARPGYIYVSADGSDNTFLREHWVKDTGTMTSATFPFTDSSFTDCIFDFPVSVTLASSSTDSGCTFTSGHTHT